MIELTEAEVWMLWTKLFAAERPEGLTTAQAYDAILLTLGSSILKEALRDHRIEQNSH